MTYYSDVRKIIKYKKNSKLKNIGICLFESNSKLS